ncbi:radical SAM family heme chaperone HemW [soil metagenome]
MSLPLSLYIHFPWCIRKCPYCDFNSHTLKGAIPEEDYIDALIADLEHDLVLRPAKKLTSIFLGGGTPSLFSPAAIARLLTAIAARIPFAADCEITLEANPGTVEQQRFEGFKAAGINRLSIGVQSLQDDKLKALGRIHGAKEAIKATEMAHAAGFTTFNMDLMFGLPKQSIDDALYDLTTAIALQPTHISWYQLTLEPNTLFHHQPPILPDDEYLWEMQQLGQALLAQAGFVQYEVSAYSKVGHQCRHNLNYWQFGDYLGIGAGAHAKITSHLGVSRSSKWKNPKDYLQAKNNSYIAETQIIATNELPFEFMLNVLRLQQPIPVNLFAERTGCTVDQIEAQITQAVNRGLLCCQQQQWHVTDLGRQFLNDLTAIFLPY